MGASRGAIRAARFGAALFLPLALACTGLLGVFIGPTVTEAVRYAFTGAAVDPAATGSVHPVISGYGIDDRGK